MIRKMLGAIFLITTLSVYGADNSIYIDQAGDNSTISITQDGGGNEVYDVGAGATTTTAATSSSPASARAAGRVASGASGESRETRRADDCVGQAGAACGGAQCCWREGVKGRLVARGYEALQARAPGERQKKIGGRARAL